MTRRSLQDAVSFLTIVPFPCPLVSFQPAERISRALAWFPFVGALIGAVGAGVVFLSAGHWPYPIATLLGLAAMVVLTGGLHLDGFADTVDGLASWKDREAALQVMADSRVGALGAAAVVLLLGLKWSLLQAMPTDALGRNLVLIHCVSRWAIVVSAQTFPYVPNKPGLGRLATDRKSPAAVAAASCIAVGVALLCGGPWRGIGAMVLAGLLLVGFNRVFLARLGGITGDTLGAVNEGVEVGLALFLTVR